MSSPCKISRRIDDTIFEQKLCNGKSTPGHFNLSLNRCSPATLPPFNLDAFQCAAMESSSSKKITAEVK